MRAKARKVKTPASETGSNTPNMRNGQHSENDKISRAYYNRRAL